MNIRFLRSLIVLSLAVLSVGCATRGGPVTKTMSDADFVASSAEARAEYLAAVREEAVLMEMKKNIEYSAERPVFYGDSITGFTLQWNKKLKLVSVYPGHSTGATGMETAAILVLRSDEDGNILYQESGGVEKPTTLLSNVASQKGLGRVFIEGGFKVLAAGVNGAWAADIRADSCNDGNCSGDTTLINAGGNTSAAAISEAVSGSTSVTDFEAVLGACPDASCGGAF